MVRAQSKALLLAPRVFHLRGNFLMRFSFRWFFIFTFAFCLLNYSQAQPLPERAPLLGKVTTTAGLPIGGATVTVTRQDTQIVGEAAFWGGRLLTGADGVFSFPEGEEGIYSLAVNAEGYESFAGTLEWGPKSPLYQTKMLKLTPQPLRVSMPDGKPAAGATVFLYLRGQPPGHVASYKLVADEEGQLALPPITPAAYWLHIIVPKVGVFILPNLVVKENQPQLLDVKLQTAGAIRVSAHASDGKAMGGVALSIKEILSDAAAQAEGGIAQGNDGALYIKTQSKAELVTADSSGQMEISDVAPGRYLVRLYLPGEANPVAQTIEVKAGETSEVSGVYTLQTTKAPLQLTVQTSDGKPAADKEFVARLQATRNATPVVLEGPPIPPDVAPTVANLFQGVLERRIKTDGDGKAILFPVRPGEWQVTLLTLEQMADEAIKVRSQGTNVKISEQGGELTIKLTP